MTWRTQRFQTADGAGTALVLGLLLVLAGCSDDPAEPGTSGGGTAEASIPAEVILEWDRMKEAQETILGIKEDDSPQRGDLQKTLKGREIRFRSMVEARNCQVEFSEELRMEILESGMKSQTHPRASQRALWLFGILDGFEGDGAFEIHRDLLLDPNLIIAVRRRAAYSMGRLDTDAAAAIFLTYVRTTTEPRSDWAKVLVDVLHKYDYPRVIDLILVGLETSENDQVLIRLCVVAANHSDARVIPPLKNLALRASSPFVRVNAARTLAKHVGGPSMDFLQSLHDNISPELPVADRDILQKGFLRVIQTTRYNGPGPLALSWR